jgi:antagonist of KipI
MIEVVKAPPFATVQDLGWPTGRAMGLPRGGAMDPGLLQRVNRALGNDLGAAAIEWALGPGTLRFERAAFAVVTFGAAARLDGAPQHKVLIDVPIGGVLEILPKQEERFTYIGVRGGIDAPLLMGSRSTYLPGAFGGYLGRRLQAGDRLAIGPEPEQPTPGRLNLPLSADPTADLVLRVTRGPQWDRFDGALRDLFFASRYNVSSTSDRMGYRLNGPAVPPKEAATLPSEAACPGAIQIPDDGQPIVLMPDGPTVGGYPKLGVVIQEDLARLAQCQPGRGVRFREV